MTNRKLCAFTCCDAKYVPHAIVALTSARKWMPDLDLVLVSDSLSGSDVKDLERYGIAAVLDPLEGHFSRTWNYPRPSYYIFAAPKLLHARGYAAGLYVDADVIVNGDLRAPVAATTALAGVEVGKIKTILRDDVTKIEACFGKLPDTPRIQSGVLAMNFAQLTEASLLEKLSALYNKCIEIGAPRKGDDSLLALSQHVHPEIESAALDPAFNIIEYEALKNGSEEWHRRGEATLSSDAIFHFCAKSGKPWLDPDRFPSFRAKYFTHKWQRHTVDTLHEHDLGRWFPRLKKSLRSDHLRFYWYPKKNVGDQITPYFLSKCTANGAKSISEKKISEIEKKPANLKKIFGSFYSLIFKTRATRARYVTSCGSIVRLCGNHALVFGSGIRSENQEVAKPFIRFVRGPLTRDRYVSEGVECPAVFGDPALVLPRIFDPDVKKIYDLGIIPHFTEVEAFRETWDLQEGQTILDARTDDVEAFLLGLLQCRRTLSSSLHGLIFSHAYRIPTRHVIITDTIFGDGTKFRDHYATVNLRHDPVDLREDVGSGRNWGLLANEVVDFDDRFLWDECFFDSAGLKTSLRLPY